MADEWLTTTEAAALPWIKHKAITICRHACAGLIPGAVHDPTSNRWKLPLAGLQQAYGTRAQPVTSAAQVDAGRAKRRGRSARKAPTSAS